MDHLKGPEERGRSLGSLCKSLVGIESCHLNLHKVQQMDSMTQRVCHHVLLTLLMAKDEDEVLQILDPLGVSIAQLPLRVQILQGLMVREEYKLLMKEVMSPVFESSNGGVELTIVSGVPKPHVIQFLAEVLDGVTLLAKDIPDTDTRSVIGNLEYLAKVG